MVDALSVGFVLGGLVFVFAGAVLAVYGVAVLGACLGGAAGYLLAPAVGSGVVGVAAVTVLGVVAGVVVAYLLLSLAVAALSCLGGAYAGLILVAPLVGDGSAAVTGLVVLAAGGAAAFLGSFLTRTMMILLTSFVGAALASGSVTPGDLAAAQARATVEPVLFDPFSVLFLGAFLLGILAQFGLFRVGHATAVVARLPGARRLRDGVDDSGEADTDRGGA